MQITLCYCNNKEDLEHYQKVLVRKGNIPFKAKHHFVWTYDSETEILKDHLKRYKGYYKKMAINQIHKVVTLIEWYLLHRIIYDIDQNRNISKYPLKNNNFKEPTNFIKKEVILRKRNAHEYYTEKEEIKATINELNFKCEEITS